MRCIRGLDWQSFIFITLVICSYCELPKQGKAELDGCVLCDGWLHVELEGGGWMEGTKDKWNGHRDYSSFSYPLALNPKNFSLTSPVNVAQCSGQNSCWFIVRMYSDFFQYNYWLLLLFYFRPCNYIILYVYVHILLLLSYQLIACILPYVSHTTQLKHCRLIVFLWKLGA